MKNTTTYTNKNNQNIIKTKKIKMKQKVKNNQKAHNNKQTWGNLKTKKKQRKTSNKKHRYTTLGNGTQNKANQTITNKKMQSQKYKEQKQQQKTNLRKTKQNIVVINENDQTLKHTSTKTS